MIEAGNAHGHGECLVEHGNAVAAGPAALAARRKQVAEAWVVLGALLQQPVGQAKGQPTAHEALVPQPPQILQAELVAVAVAPLFGREQVRQQLPLTRVWLAADGGGGGSGVGVAAVVGTAPVFGTGTSACCSPPRPPGIRRRFCRFCCFSRSRRSRRSRRSHRFYRSRRSRRGRLGRRHRQTAPTAAPQVVAGNGVLVLADDAEQGARDEAQGVDVVQVAGGDDADLELDRQRVQRQGREAVAVGGGAWRYGGRVTTG